MKQQYKDVFLSYRKEVKPLVARIESLRTLIPDQVVPDVATAFEYIALADDPKLSEEQQRVNIDKARFWVMHCKSQCYQHLIGTLNKRINLFLERAGRRFLLGMGNGKLLGVINEKKAEFKELRSQCNLSDNVTCEDEVRDLPLYQKAYWKLLRPYLIVLKNSDDGNMGFCPQFVEFDNGKFWGQFCTYRNMATKYVTKAKRFETISTEKAYENYEMMVATYLRMEGLLFDNYKALSQCRKDALMEKKRGLLTQIWDVLSSNWIAACLSSVISFVVAKLVISTFFLT